MCYAHYISAHLSHHINQNNVFSSSLLQAPITRVTNLY
jgi:hypothetical protein